MFQMRKKLLLAVVGSLSALLARIWIGSLRLKSRVTVPGMEPFARDKTTPRIFLLWHDTLLLPASRFGKCHGYTLVSQSEDGDYANAFGTKLGWQTVRGSSSRGGPAARATFLALAERNDKADWYFTADGPKGPKHVLKFGAILLAAKTGYPIVPIGVAFDRPWRLKSWDRFALPKPFSRACVVYGCPIHVPAVSDREVLPQFESLVQDQMDRVEEEATRLLACARGRVRGPISYHQVSAPAAGCARAHHPSVGSEKD